jgi:hypothetical protein
MGLSHIRHNPPPPNDTSAVERGTASGRHHNFAPPPTHTHTPIIKTVPVDVAEKFFCGWNENKEKECGCVMLKTILFLISLSS